MAMISREDALAAIVEERSSEIVEAAVTQSVALSAFRRINMGTSTYRMPLLETLPTAQWLVPSMDPDTPDDVDKAVKPTTTMSWTTQDLVAEEIATIALIPENVLDDMNFDVWGEVRARVSEAIGRTIDQAIFFGSAPVGGIPASFPVGGLVGRSIAANHDYELHAGGATEDIAEAFSQTMGLVEADGFDPGTGFTGTFLRPRLRGLRDSNGSPLYVPSLRTGGATDSLMGVSLQYVNNGSWNSATALALVGDASLGVIGMRQDLTTKPLDQATVNGINLAERDMVGLRVKMRIGFTVLVPKGLSQSATPYPFAVLVPDATP